jgi:hypothetical protein
MGQPGQSEQLAHPPPLPNKLKLARKKKKKKAKLCNIVTATSLLN